MKTKEEEYERKVRIEEAHEEYERKVQLLFEEYQKKRKKIIGEKEKVCEVCGK